MIDQYDLYNGLPPHVRGSDTSEAAAISMLESASTIRARVFRYISAYKDQGLTCDEAEAAMDLRHQTASARIRELFLEGAIRDSGVRRRTRSGRKATVWVKT